MLKTLLMMGCLIFCLKTFAIDSSISKPEYDYILPSPTPWLKDRVQLLNILPANAIVVELGVWYGDYARTIYHHSKPNKLYLIDCWENQSRDVYNDNIADGPQEAYYKEVYDSFHNYSNVSIIKAYSHEAVKFFPDESIDWIYIDANHCYEAVKQDLHLWYPKIKKNGFICGHDYFQYKTFGVNQAVNEFLIENNLSLIYLTEEEGPRSFAIKKP